MLSLMLRCKQATYLVCEALDRPLNWREKIELWLHLAVCYGCRRFIRQQQQLHQAFQCLREQPEGLPLSLKSPPSPRDFPPQPPTEKTS